MQKGTNGDETWPMTKPSHAIQVGGTTHPDAPLPARPTELKSKQRHPSHSQSNRTHYDHVKILQPYLDGPSPLKKKAQSLPQTQKQTMPGPQPRQSRPAAGIRFPEVLWLPIPYHWRRTTDRAGGLGCRRGGGRILSGVQCLPSKCSAAEKNQKQRKEQDCRKRKGRLKGQVTAQVQDDTPWRCKSGVPAQYKHAHEKLIQNSHSGGCDDTARIAKPAVDPCNLCDSLLRRRLRETLGTAGRTTVELGASPLDGEPKSTPAWLAPATNSATSRGIPAARPVANDAWWAAPSGFRTIAARAFGPDSAVAARSIMAPRGTSGCSATSDRRALRRRSTWACASSAAAVADRNAAAATCFRWAYVVFPHTIDGTFHWTPFFRRTESFPVGVNEISNAFDKEGVCGRWPFSRRKWQLQRHGDTDTRKTELVVRIWLSRSGREK